MNYVITASDHAFLQHLYDFCLSLRREGNYKDEIIVFYYYEKENTFLIQALFDSLNVNWVLIEKSSKSHVSHNVFFDVVPILEDMQQDDKIIIYDADIWFQDDVNFIFQEKGDKLLCAPDVIVYDHISKEELIEELKEYSEYYLEYCDGITDRQYYQDNILKFADHRWYHMNSGFMFGSQQTLLSYLKLFFDFYQLNHSKNIRKIYPLDQFVWNIILEELDYDMSWCQYNCTLNELNMPNIKKKEGIIYYGDQKAIAIHTQAYKSNQAYLYNK